MQGPQIEVVGNGDEGPRAEPPECSTSSFSSPGGFDMSAAGVGGTPTVGSGCPKAEYFCKPDSISHAILHINILYCKCAKPSTTGFALTALHLILNLEAIWFSTWQALNDSYMAVITLHHGSDDTVGKVTRLVNGTPIFRPLGIKNP